MFFYLSKILWLIAAPSNLVVIAILLVGAIAARPCGRRTRLLIGFGAVLLVVVCFAPLGRLLLEPLEYRFPRADLTGIDPAGIIVLGGPIDPTLGAAHGEVHLSDGAERLTTGVMLARRFPNAPLIYTGGSNAVVFDEAPEAADAKALWVSLGVAADRIVTEDRSRNTYENAQNLREMLHPRAGRRYVLVTSAFHMPRSVGLFRRAGFDVLPYPVDFRTTGGWQDCVPAREASAGLGALDFAAREWIGLVAYKLSGKIDAVLPAR